MKVMFIATYEGLTGASYSLLGMLKEIRTAGHQVFVVMLKDGALRELLQNNHIPYTILKGYPWVIRQELANKPKQRIKWGVKRIYNRIAEKKIESLIQTEQIDILHINTSASGVGALAAMRSNIPLVWHIREFVEEDLHKVFYQQAKSLRLIEKANQVIAISNSVKEKFQSRMPNAKIKVIYNGVDKAPYEKGRVSPILLNDECVITIAGRVDPEKGHLDLLKAAVKLFECGIKQFHIQIVGKSQNPDYEASLIEYVKNHKLEQCVSFLGFRKDIADILLKSDISVVSSVKEAFGRVTVESMMAGNIVVGANTGGTLELLANSHGLLYEQGNVDSLFQQLKWIMEHKEEARELAESAREYALQTFTAMNNAREVIAVYEQLRRKNDNAQCN